MNIEPREILGKIIFSDDEKKMLQVISEAANSIGIKAYVVGGYVRDKILGRSSTDLDITCVGDGIELAKLSKQKLFIKNDPVIFKNFGTAQIVYQKFKIEFIGARKESYSFESRNPKVSKGTLTDDVSRRDFTINALVIPLDNIDDPLILDFYNGLDDLEKGLIRTPLEPDVTFSDDPLRMMRAVRFACQLGFSIVDTTFESINKNSDRISILSMERVTEELQKIIASNEPSKGFKLLEKSGLLTYILPELLDLAGIETMDGNSHKDNYLHTLQVLDQLAQSSDNIWLRWAALLHDIGKSKTKKYISNEGWTFFSHENVGAKMVYTIFNRLKLPLDHKMKYVQKLVRLHLRPMTLVDEIVTDSAVRRLLFDAGDDIDDLMLLAKADITSKNQLKITKFRQNYDLVIEKLREVEEKDQLRNWKSPISGDEIMEAFDIKPSREIGIIKEEIKEAILEGNIPNERDAAWNLMISKGIELGLTPINKSNHESI